MEEIKEIINALQNIFNSNEFFLYQDFLGDIRKIKRLINTILLFKIEKTDFLNSDYNKIDIIHLLLLYVNYPHIFRKIYNTETDGKYGFFSLKSNGYFAERKFENSSYFTEYIKKVTLNQAFLLNKLFDVKQNLGNASNISEDVRRTRACFNGGGGTNRNLERYLNLIVKLSKQNRVESYQFYVNMRRQFLQEEGVKLDDIFKNKEFDFEKGELSHDKFWTVITSSSSDFNQNQGAHVLSYLMDHLPDYSLLEGENIGAGTRRRLIYSLVKLLNEAPWNITQATSYNDIRTSVIANWIFGEDDHVSAGVLNTLAKPERGILGFYDLMCFRLYCSADRAGSIFNLQKALFAHGGSTASLSGSLIEYAQEEMREISQKIFQMFKAQYITQQKNIFVEIDNLTQGAFVGMNIKFLQNKVTSGEIEQSFLDQIIAKEKTSIKLFVIYQLGNSIIESGVGCGVYDEAGNKDQKGIAEEINKYLFDFCFNPEVDGGNFEIFLDYLLMNFRSKYVWHENEIPGAMNEFTKVLEVDRLKNYWKQNREIIVSLHLDKKDKSVFTYNYTANYVYDLPDVYRTLDDLICSESP